MKILNTIKIRLSSIFFKNSKEYWENRYASGGNSGIGSYGDFAQFKAKTINTFIKDNNINSVIEFGCGDGNQLALIEYKDYTGIDISQSAINKCRSTYAQHSNKKFFHTSEFPATTADLSISLDVLYHLTEDDIYDEYLKRLFLASNHYVIIYSTNFQEKTTTRAINKHVKHRKFTNWVIENQPNWECISHTPGPFLLGRKSTPFTIDFFIYRKTD